jgi:hypothetical protein
MKTHPVMIPPLLALALAASACVGEADSGVTEDDEDVASAEQEIITSSFSSSTSTTTTTTTSTMNTTVIWPAGPITWNGTVGTWPIAVWSSAPLDFIAVDLGVYANLTLTPGMMDSAGVLTPLPGVTAAPISAACMATITTGLEARAPRPMPKLLPGRSVGGAGFGMPFPVTPTITPSALMLTGLPAPSGVTPLVINVSFDAANAASLAGLSIFTGQTAAGGAAPASAVGMSLANPMFTSTILSITPPQIAR